MEIIDKDESIIKKRKKDYISAKSFIQIFNHFMISLLTFKIIIYD